MSHWPEDHIDFFSNDYLGLAKDSNGLNGKEGSGGSRLLAGNHLAHEKLEESLSKLYKGQALLFNSGFDANIALFSSIPQKADVILYDAKVHNSIRQGIRLSNASAYKFQHNDLEDLEKHLSKHKGKQIFIAIESVYSMDGNQCDLGAIVSLAQKYDAAIILDEAHSNGIFGDKGEGLAVELGLEKFIFARMLGFGKAIGRHGAAVLGSQSLKDYLVNYASSFIYSTAMSEAQVASISHSLKVLQSEPQRRAKLRQNISYFKAKSEGKAKLVCTNSPIQFIKVEGNANAKALANSLQEKGINIAAVLSPTVEPGFERLRVCLHSFNSQEEIDLLLISI